MNQLPPATVEPAPLPPPQPRRRRWVSLLLSLVLFGSGLVIGAAGGLVYVRHEILQAIHNPREMPAKIAHRLRWKLGLSDEQTAKVLAVLQTRQQALQAIRGRVQPDVEAQLDLVESDVAAVLDAKQRETWQQAFRNMRQQWVPPMPTAEKSRAKAGD